MDEAEITFTANFYDILLSSDFADSSRLFILSRLSHLDPLFSFYLLVLTFSLVTRKGSRWRC